MKKNAILILALLFISCTNKQVDREIKVEKNKIIEELKSGDDKKSYLRELLKKTEYTKLDYMIVEELKKSGYDFNSYIDQKDSYITSLIKNGEKKDYEMLIHLKKMGYSYNFIDTDGNNLITYGVLNYQNEYGSEILDFLLDLDIDINKKNNGGNTAGVYLLLRQYSNINREIFQKLLDNNLNINEKIGENEDNYLGILANDYNGILDTSLAEFFVLNGLDVNYENKLGEKPIDILIKNPNFYNKSNFLTLLNKKGDLDLNKKNKEGINATFNLIMNINQLENQDLLPIFLSLGADIKVVDDEGNNLLMYAAMFGKYEVYYRLSEFLLLTGIDPNSENELGENAINLLVKYGESSVYTLNLLNLYGGDIFNKDNMGNNPLHDSVISFKGENSIEIIEYLLANGGDIYEENNFEYTPLMMSIIYGGRENGVEAIKYYSSLYEDLNITNSFGYTPLMTAAQYGNDNTLEIIDYLIASGADINKEQEDGTSALMIAAINTTSTSSLPIVKKLVEHGAKLDIEIKKEWIDEENNVKWEVGDSVFELVEKYINISSNEETLEYLNNL